MLFLCMALSSRYHLRHRILRWYRHQQVDVVGQQVALLHAALLLRRQLAKHLTQVCPQLTVQYLPAAFWGEYDVVIPQVKGLAGCW
jgi:hypothetical protein